MDERRGVDRRLLAVPVLLCLLALVPLPRHLLGWLDSKILDLFFVLLSRPTPQPAAVVVAKDQTLLDVLGREPDRQDLARVLTALSEAGATLAALDFIYDLPQSTASDSVLTKALAQGPAAVLAERFRRRGALGPAGTIQTADASAERPPWPLPLHEPIAAAATDRGLVNIFTDYDGSVRYLPLGFLPAGASEMRPTLAFSAWIQHLLRDLDVKALGAPASLLSEEADFQQKALAWLEEALNRAPHSFQGLGHSGLDGILRRREILALAHHAAGGRQMSAASAWRAVAQSMPLDKLPPRTWLSLPSEPLPWMGPTLAPCLRIPFRRPPLPLKGDGLPVVSMGLILAAQEGAGTATLVIPPSSPQPAQPVWLAFDLSQPGTGSLEGQAIDFHGNPLPGIPVLALREGGGFWARIDTDLQGRYRLTDLPPGKYSLELSLSTPTGQQRLLLETPATIQATPVQIPVARFLPQQSTLEAPLTPASQPRQAVLFADGVWVGPAEAAAQPPPGLEATPLEEGRVALLDPATPWKIICTSEATVPTGSASLEMSGLCPSLGARLVLTRPDVRPDKSRALELDLLAGLATTLTTSPPEVADPETQVQFDFHLAENLPADTQIWFLTESGQWLAASGPTGRLQLTSGRYRVLAQSGPNRGSYTRLAGLVRDRAVFLGTHLVEDLDFRITPINFLDRDFPYLPGVNLHALLYSALVHQDFLRPTFLHPDWSAFAWPLWHLLVVVPLLFGIDEIFRRQGAVQGGLSAVLLAIVWLTTAALAFRQGWLLPSALMLTCLATFGPARGLHAYLAARSRERQTRTTFGRFVSARVVQRILENPEALRRGGDRRLLTVLFTDLAGFTTISERMPPEALTALMNEYLDAMTRVLFAHGGTLDKYIGDAVMGFWNYPEPQPDHAQRAADCVLAMQGRLADLAAAWKAQGLPDLSMRAGIHTAECVVGFIGSDVQMNFTCLGDGVNLAARLEGANKAYGTLSMLSEATLERLPPHRFRTRFLDFLAVKGKERPVRVSELLGHTDIPDLDTEAKLKLHDQGIQAYLARDWDAAETAFRQILARWPEDGPAATYLDRCEAFRRTPPPTDWDGRFTLHEK